MKNKIALSLLILLVVIGLFNSFTSEKDRKEILRDIKSAFRNNPNIPRIEHKEIVENGECSKYINNPDYRKYENEAENDCEKELGGWISSGKKFFDFMDERKACVSKRLSEPTAPKSIILSRTSCVKQIGYEKWLTVHDITWFKLYSKFYIDRNQERVQEILADVTDDYGDERLITTIGKNCASCHQNWIYVFKGTKKLFETTGDDATISALLNNKGFSIIQPIRKGDEALCCPSEFKTDTYLWKGSAFIKQ